MNLLETEDFQATLSQQLKETKTLTVLSAYVTDSAVDSYLDDLKHISVTFVARASPSDLLTGASTLSALRKLVCIGADVRIHPSLHAKLYLLDESQMYVGSANFTNRGLKISGYGNLELMSEFLASESDKRLIDAIVSDSRQLTFDLLEKMQNHIEDSSSDEQWWPEAVVTGSQKLWVNDFPWTNPFLPGEATNGDRDHDNVLFASVNSDIKPEHLAKTKVFRWLIDTLTKSNDTTLYFGELSSMIHHAIQDDPTPYRSDVKKLTQNLLGYCQYYLPEFILIDRPRHSQRVQLLKMPSKMNTQ